MRNTLLLLFCLTSVLTVAAQQHRITGHVKDPKGQAIPAATVRTADGKFGAITDLEGAYTLDIPSGKPCDITSTCIGYLPATLKATANTSVLNFILQEDRKAIDEVVVVGYGTQKRSHLTSSIEVVKGEDIAQMPVNNIDEALAGKVAGLGVLVTTGDPSSNKEADIRIRGISGSPLLVIDGVPRFGNTTSDGETRLSDLNPDDIESISILKDAAASAVYGARAANGVILVQTKRGKNEGKVKVDYHGQYNVSEATYLPKFLNAYDFATLFNKAVDANGTDTYEKYDLTALSSNPNLYGNENLLDYLNKTGYTTRHSVSVSGGGKGVRYYVTGGYSKNKGLYANMGRDRYNYGLKLDADIIKGMTLSVDITGNRSDNINTSFSTLDAAYNYSPLQVLRFTDGNLASISGSNPLININGDGGYYRYRSRFLTLSATLRYEIPGVKGLSAYIKGTLDDNSTTTTNFQKPVKLYLYDNITGTTSPDANTVYPNAKITMQQEDRNIDNRLYEAGLNYNNTFNKKHEVGATAVLNYQSYRNLYLSGKNNNMAGSFPEIIGSASDATLYGTEVYNQRASVIGRLNYGYNRTIYTEFSFRVDGSTKFAPSKRWGFFPTFSGSYCLSNERFFQDWHQEALSQVKFRASTGWLGVDAGLSDFNYLTNYIFSPNYGYQIGGNFTPGLIFDTGNFPNEDLGWEKSHDYNFGIDLGFFKNKLSTTFEYYVRYRTNMIMDAPSYLFPPSTGTGGALPSLNFGKVKAWGWDWSITHRNKIGKVNYDIAFNISSTNDKILDYGDESTVSPSQRRKGTHYSSWNLYDAAGLFQSYEEIASWPVDQDGMGNTTLAPGDIKYRDHDGNGVLTEADKIYVKNSSYPDLFYGIRIGLEYCRWRFSAQFQGAGGYNQKVNELYTLESNSLQRFQDYHVTDTWSESNPNARYPRIKFTSKSDNNRLESTFWIRKCNYLRLKAISVGYSFAPKVLAHYGLRSLSVNLTAGNLFTFSSLHNMDPESMRGYPLQRTYGLSINLGI